MHHHVPNCLMHPLPGDDLDPVGNLLRDLDRTVTDLQFINPVRLYGDEALITGALLALTIIQQRIREQHAQAAE